MPTPSPKSNTKKSRYGWVPDLPDHRDILYGAVRRVPAALPSKMDLRSLCSTVEDQGNLGSCTGNALAGALEFLERKDKVPYAELSRLFHHALQLSCRPESCGRFMDDQKRGGDVNYA